MDNEFTYSIDPALSLRFRTPVLSILKPQSVPHTLLAALMDDEKEWQKRESKDPRKKDFTFPYFRLRPIHSYTLLQKLAITHKLTLDGKKIIGDFFRALGLNTL